MTRMGGTGGPGDVGSRPGLGGRVLHLSLERVRATPRKGSGAERTASSARSSEHAPRAKRSSTRRCGVTRSACRGQRSQDQLVIGRRVPKPEWRTATNDTHMRRKRWRNECFNVLGVRQSGGRRKGSDRGRKSAPGHSVRLDVAVSKTGVKAPR